MCGEEVLIIWKRVVMRNTIFIINQLIEQRSNLMKEVAIDKQKGKFVYFKERRIRRLTNKLIKLQECT